MFLMILISSTYALLIMASGGRAPSGAKHRLSPSRFGNRDGITERVFGRKARAVIDVAGLIPLAAPGGCVLFFTANLGKIPEQSLPLHIDLRLFAEQIAVGVQHRRDHGVKIALHLVRRTAHVTLRVKF